MSLRISLKRYSRKKKCRKEETTRVNLFTHRKLNIGLEFSNRWTEITVCSEINWKHGQDKKDKEINKEAAVTEIHSRKLKGKQRGLTGIKYWKDVVMLI